MSVRISVISLPHSVMRRSAFQHQARDTVLSWSFFDAHQEPSLPLLNETSRLSPNRSRTLTAGEAACFSSHAAVWHDFLGSKDDRLIVFEDDVIVDWDYIHFLAQFDFDSAGIHYLRLFNKTPVKNSVIISPFLSQYHHLVWNLQRPLGTQAYMLTRNGASIFSAHCSRIIRPIDQEMDRAWAHGLPSLTIHPSPIIERFTPSSIGEARFAASDPYRKLSVSYWLEGTRKAVFNNALHRQVFKNRISTPIAALLHNAKEIQ